MTGEKFKLPEIVRQRVDNSYAEIRRKATKRKRRKKWVATIIVSAAMLALAFAITLTNENAVAQLKVWLGQDLKGADQAIGEGYMKTGEIDKIPVMTDQDISLRVTKVIYDRSALLFQLEIDTTKYNLQDITNVQSTFTLQDANNNYIAEDVYEDEERKLSVDEAIKFNAICEYHEKISDSKILLECSVTTLTDELPNLAAGVVTINSLRFISNDNYDDSIVERGQWAFTIPTQKPIADVVYEQVKPNKDFTITSAVATLTGLTMKIEASDGELRERESLGGQYLVDDKGIHYGIANGNSYEEEIGDKLYHIVKMDFSVINKSDELTLVFPYHDSLEDVKLVRKK